MGSPADVRTEPIAQIPKHVVVQAKRAAAEIEILQEGQSIQSLGKLVCRVCVEATGFAPQRLDDPERDVLVLRKDCQFAEPTELLLRQILKACLDAGADRPVALLIIFRV